MTTNRGSTYIPVYLISLTHPQLIPLVGEVDGVTLDGTLRIANYRHNFVSRGDTFAPGFFKPKPPKMGDRRAALLLSIDNVDQRITKVVRALSARAILTLEKVYAHEPDVVRKSWAGYESKGFGIDAAEVTGSFGPPDTSGAFMGIRITPGDFPAAFV